MGRQRRRSVIKTAAVSVAVSLAGCLDATGDGDAGSKPDTEPDTESVAESEGSEEDDEADSDTGSGSESPRGSSEATPGDGETDGSVAVGDRLYTRWLPEPAFRPSAVGSATSTSAVGSATSMSFVYEDGAALRSIADSLPDDAVVLGENALPLVEAGRTDEILLLQTPLLRPEFQVFTPPRVIAGEFDRERVVESYLRLDDVEWDRQAEHGDFTFIANRTDERDTAVGPVSIGVSESVVLYRTHTGENQGTEGIEMLADAGAGRIDRIHEVEPRVARVFEVISGSTIASLFYGAQFKTNSSEDTPEGLVGAGQGYTVGEEQTEHVLVYVFTDNSSAAAAGELENFPWEDERGRNLSETVDGPLYIARQTIPTAEFEKFPDL